MPGGRVRLKRPLYFVRHGETDWNVERRYQGRLETHLNEKGREQAARNGRALMARIDKPERHVFIASPLARAVETMAIVRTEMGLDGRVFGRDDRIAEIDLGEWDGKTYDEIERETPGIFARRERDKWRFRPPGGESYAEAAARVRDFLLHLKRPAVIVGHGATGRILRGYLLGLGRNRVPGLSSPHDAVFRIERGREFVI